MSIKRFLVFAFDGYYPAGGWEDRILATNSREEAHAAASKSKMEFSYVIDLVTGLEDPSGEGSSGSQTPPS